MSKAVLTARTGKYVAHLLVRRDEVLAPLPEEEEVAYALYLATRSRSRRGPLKDLRVALVTRVYYSFIVKRFRGDHSLVFDPYRESVYRITLHALDKSFIDHILKTPEHRGPEGFPEKLSLVERAVREMLETEKYVEIEEYSVKGLVGDQQVVRELSLLLEHRVDYRLPGLRLGFKKPRVEESVSAVNEVVDRVAETIGYVTMAIGELSRLASLWERKLLESREQASGEAGVEDVLKSTYKRLELVKTMLLALSDRAKKAEKQVMSVVIPTPAGGEGLYWIPVYLVAYSTGSEEIAESRIIPPVAVTPASRGRGVEVEVFKGIGRYLKSIENLAEDPAYSDWVVELNLLRRIPMSTIEKSLYKLLEKALIEERDVERIAESIAAEQIE